ncbi:hypothetical protein RBB50_009821 [Rhinocladiella similis]
MAYKFVNLSPEQIEARRHALDRAGWHAWLSPVVLMAAVSVYRRFLSRWANSTQARTRRKIRWVSWVLGTTTYVPELGPLAVQVFGLAYTAWLVYLVFRGTGEDYMHLTKAFGHVGVSQMPVQYLMSVKWANKYNPIEIATGGLRLSHEKVNVYHRFFGRVVHAFLAVHAVLYLRFFAKMGWLEKRVRDWDVRFGLLAFWSVNFLAVLSLPAVRRWAYHRLFWRSHVVLGVAVPVFVYAHVKWTRLYVGQVAVVWVVNVVMRRWASEVVQVSCEDVQGTSSTTTTTTSGSRSLTSTSASTGQLIKVILSAKKGGRLAKARPGQHVYVHAPASGGGGARNPFTIVSVTDAEKGKGVEVVLVVRRLGGPGTKGLADLARTGKKADMRVEGPYGDAGDDVDRLVNVETTSPVLLVAGGVGATYTIPIYMALLNHASQSGKQPRIVKMVWLVKSVADATWGLDVLRQLRGNQIDVDLYVAGDSALMDPAQGSEMVSRAEGIHGLKIHILGRRPDIAAVVDEFFTASNADGYRSISDEDEVNVFVCGPASLSADLSKEVGRQVRESERKVRWTEEVFGFGGS